MIVVTNLKGELAAGAVPAQHESAPIASTQACRKFWRRMKHSKDLITVESSTGGAAQIKTEELWDLLASFDSRLNIPEQFKAQFDFQKKRNSAQPKVQILVNNESGISPIIATSAMVPNAPAPPANQVTNPTPNLLSKLSGWWSKKRSSQLTKTPPASG